MKKLKSLSSVASVLLRDEANPERVSGTNVAAMAGRIAALGLILADYFDWPVVERVINDPTAFGAVMWLISESAFFLRRALGRIEKNQKS